MTTNRPRLHPGIVWALLVLAVLLPANSRGADPPAGAARGHADSASQPRSGEEASTHFRRGLQLFDEGDYTLALVEFERAYQLAPTDRYRALYNIALVQMQLGRYADAARTLEKYLHEGGNGVPAARKTEVAGLLERLRLRTATIHLSFNVQNVEVTLDGKAVDPSLLTAPMLIDAGEHTLRASAPGYMAKSRTLTLAGGDRSSVQLDLVALTQSPVPSATAPLADSRPPARKVFWPGIIGTGALAAGAVISGVVMLNARNELDALQSEPGSDFGKRDAAAGRVNTAALVADVFTGLAVVTGGVTLYLSLKQHSPTAPTLAITPERVFIRASF